MERKRKLLVTASTFPRWEGDTEPRFVLDLASHMTDEFDVTALVPAAPGAKNREVLDGVEVIRYHYFPIHKWETLCYPGAIVPRIKEKKIRVLLVPFLFLSLYLHLLRLLPQFDVVHAHWLIPQGIVQSFFKKPYIVTGHGGDVTSLNKGIFKRMKIRCLKRAKKVTVVSEYAKKRIQELVPDIDVNIISMGVDTERFNKKYYVPNYFEQDDKKIVLFVGRLVEIKGVKYLIEAMRQVDALLIIVGNGPLRQSLENKAKELEGKVKFLGSKSHGELPVIFASSDILVVPSVTIGAREREGVPTTIMEAMASGLPVIASDSGGISDIVHHNENGILVEEKDCFQIVEAINTILQNEDFRVKLIENMSKFIKKYDYCFIAEQYCKIINMR